MSREDALRNIRAGLLPLAGPFEELSIAGVDVQGRTKPALLKAHIAPLFTARTVDELVRAMDRVQASLVSLGIYKDVALSISPDRIVTVVLPASNKFVARVGTNVGQSEGSGYIRGTVMNASGWGEIVSVDTSAGTRTKSSHILNAAVPLPVESLVGWKAEGLVYSSEKMLEWANSWARIKGFTLRFTKGAAYSFGVDSVLRTLASKRTLASTTIQDEAGNSFKNSVFFNWRTDNRVPTETILGPGRGYFLDVHNELALGASTYPFYKFKASFHSAFDVFRSVTAAFNFKTGVLIPFAGESHVLDRLNLGGPLDLRAFRLNHVGPHDAGDAIGGNTMAAAGLSLFTPVPRVANPALKLHMFLNGGMLGGMQRGASMLPSVSSGFGVVYMHPSARFELNIAAPLVAHADELTHKGLQLGIGIEFL